MSNTVDNTQAGAQADAILALDGDDPDETSRMLRDSLDRAEITGEAYRAIVLHRARAEADESGSVA